MWEAIEDEVQGRKQEVPSFQRALDEKLEMLTQAFRIGIGESIRTLGDAVDDRLVAIEERMQEMEEQLVSVADRAQRGIDAAVKENMEQLAASQNKEPSDWSDWSLLDNAGALIGNSSSGIMETPALGVPCVNIGDRQRGRMRAANIIDVEPDADAIFEAVGRATDPSFARELTGLFNPYGDGDAGRRMAEAIASAPPRDVLLRKQVSSGAVAPAVDDRQDVVDVRIAIAVRIALTTAAAVVREHLEHIVDIDESIAIEITRA